MRKKVVLLEFESRNSKYKFDPPLPPPPRTNRRHCIFRLVAHVPRAIAASFNGKGNMGVMSSMVKILLNDVVLLVLCPSFLSASPIEPCVHSICKFTDPFRQVHRPIQASSWARSKIRRIKICEIGGGSRDFFFNMEVHPQLEMGVWSGCGKKMQEEEGRKKRVVMIDHGVVVVAMVMVVWWCGGVMINDHDGGGGGGEGNSGGGGGEGRKGL